MSDTTDQPRPLYGDSFIPGWPKALACPWGPYPGRVVAHHDGDTPIIEIVPFPNDRKEIRVRMYGMQAPELSNPGGREAADYLAQLIPIGSRVRFLPLINRAGQLVFSFDRQVGTIERELDDEDAAEDVIHAVNDRRLKATACHLY